MTGNFNLKAKVDMDAVPVIHQKFSGCRERPGITNADIEKILQPEVLPVSAVWKIFLCMHR